MPASTILKEVGRHRSECASSRFARVDSDLAQVTSGHLRSPQVTSGHLRSPQVTSGHPTQRTSGCRCLLLKLLGPSLPTGLGDAEKLLQGEGHPAPRLGKLLSHHRLRGFAPPKVHVGHAKYSSLP